MEAVQQLGLRSPGSSASRRLHLLKPCSSSSATAYNSTSSSSPFPWRRARRRPPHSFPSTVTASTVACRSTIHGSSKVAYRLARDFQFGSTPETPSPAEPNPTLLSVHPPLPPPAASDRTVSLPIDFYKVLGAETHFLGDGIRRAFDARCSAPPLDGFSDDALLARRQILQAACETLSSPASRGNYNQALLDDHDAALVAQVSWDKVPGALCLLQESGEAEVVLQVGNRLLRERLSKPFKRDVVLAMVLAYVDRSRDAMALNPPDLISSCDALDRALKLLKEEGATNLAPTLQAQIDETLDEITPLCVLELLALPLDEEHQRRREEGLLGVRNISWAVGGGGAAAVGGGFTREVFMKEAFVCMTVAEQVDLYLDRPNNVPVEPFEVYAAALAFVAQAFVGKKPELVKTADSLFLQLQQAKDVALGALLDFATNTDIETEFALGRGLCSLLVGDLDGCRLWLGLDDENSPYRSPSVVDFIMQHSEENQDGDLLLGLCTLLEHWLTQVVFPRFRNTRYVQFRIGDYYDDPSVLKHLQRLEGGGASPLVAAAAIVRIRAQATAALDAIQTLWKAFPTGGRESGMDGVHYHDKNELTYEAQTEGPVLNNDGGVLDSAVEKFGEANSNASIKGVPLEKMMKAGAGILCAGVAVGLLTFACQKVLSARSDLPVTKKEVGSAMATDVINLDLPSEENSRTEVPKMAKMDARLAESIVHQWQDIKSQALGPSHHLLKLSEVLDGQMLKVWTDRASEIAQNGWFWEYKLLDLSVDSVTVSLDGRRAMVEVTLKEESKLTDLAQPKHNDSSSSVYSMRYEMSCSKSGWRITEGAVLKS